MRVKKVLWILIFVLCTDVINSMEKYKAIPIVDHTFTPTQKFNCISTSLVSYLEATIGFQPGGWDVEVLLEMLDNEWKKIKLVGLGIPTEGTEITESIVNLMNIHAHTSFNKGIEANPLHGERIELFFALIQLCQTNKYCNVLVHNVLTEQKFFETLQQSMCGSRIFFHHILFLPLHRQELSFIASTHKLIYRMIISLFCAYVKKDTAVRKHVAKQLECIEKEWFSRVEPEHVYFYREIGTGEQGRCLLIPVVQNIYRHFLPFASNV